MKAFAGNPSLFSVTCRLSDSENAVIANLNNVNTASVPFTTNCSVSGTQLQARHVSETLAGGGCSNVTSLAGIAFEQPTRVPPSAGRHVSGHHDYLIVGRYDQNIGNNDKLSVRVHTKAAFRPPTPISEPHLRCSQYQPE